VETTSGAPPEVAPARRRVPARTRLDFWYDGLLLVAFTLAYSLGFTGLAVHEWLGLGIGLALLLHLTLHWDWVVRTTRKLFTRGGFVFYGGCGSGPAFSLSDSANLIMTAATEAAVMTVVITASALRRQRRRAVRRRERMSP
jgi:hypothetical protein